MLALMFAGEVASYEVRNGVIYLLNLQTTEGTWHEREYTGTGFPKYFYLRYDNYRNCFPLMALGKFISKSREKGPRS